MNLTKLKSAVMQLTLLISCFSSTSYAITTADDQATANTIAKLLNPYLLHHPLTKDEEQPTFSFPFSPAEIDRGAAYTFALHHTLTLQDPMDAFRLELHA